MFNRFEMLDFYRVILAVILSLKNKLSAIKEIHSLRPDVFRRFDRDNNDLYAGVTSANELLSAFEDLFDKKLNDFAKANNLAPPPESEKGPRFLSRDDGKWWEKQGSGGQRVGWNEDFLKKSNDCVDFSPAI